MDMHASAISTSSSSTYPVIGEYDLTTAMTATANGRGNPSRWTPHGSHALPGPQLGRLPLLTLVRRQLFIVC